MIFLPLFQLTGKPMKKQSLRKTKSLLKHLAPMFLGPEALEDRSDTEKDLGNLTEGRG